MCRPPYARCYIFWFEIESFECVLRTRFSYHIIVVCVFVSNRVIIHFSFWISLSFRPHILYIYFHFWLGIFGTNAMQKGLYPFYLCMLDTIYFFFDNSPDARFCIFIPYWIFLSVRCTKYIQNESACGKCSAPSFLRLSTAFYVFYIVYSFLCVLFFPNACRIQLLTSRRRHEVALPFAC